MIPALSVVMPLYNGEVFLAAAIESILAQSFKDFEFIIVNDGSSDNSQSIVEKYAARDSRIVLINQENQGIVVALNKGVNNARAPLIARMDSDDIALPERFEKQYQFMTDNKDVMVSGAQIQTIYENDVMGEIIAKPVSDCECKQWLLEKGSPIAHPAAIFRKKEFWDVGGYRSIFTASQDYDLWLRLSKLGQLSNLQDVLLYYRINEQSISSKRAFDQRFLAAFGRVLFDFEKKDDLIDKQTEVKIDCVEYLNLLNFQSYENKNKAYKRILESVVNGAITRGSESYLERTLNVSVWNSIKREKLFLLEMMVRLMFASMKIRSSRYLVKIITKFTRLLLGL